MLDENFWPIGAGSGIIWTNYVDNPRYGEIYTGEFKGVGILFEYRYKGFVGWHVHIAGRRFYCNVSKEKAIAWLLYAISDPWEIIKLLENS